MKNIELNDDEIRVLIGLIDVAVRARGLEAAESGLHFVKKLQAETNGDPDAERKDNP